MKPLFSLIIALLSSLTFSFAQPIPPDPGVVVPIQLLHFNAMLKNSYVKLYWQTDIFKTNGEFEVEFCTDAKTWTTIPSTGLIKSNEKLGSYFINHLITNIKSNTVYYRLKNISLDGSTYFSKNVSVELKKSETKLSSINIINEQLTVDIFSDNQQLADLSVFTISGEKIAGQNLNLAKGISNYTISLNKRSKGILMMVIIGTDSKIVQKFYAN